MKKTRKKVFGVLGLTLVMALTAFAITMPGPGARATNSSVTDTIQVRVESNSANVDIASPVSGTTVAIPNQQISYNYEKANTVTLTLKYTDKDGNVTERTLTTFDGELQPGSGNYNLNLNDFGFGEYVIKITGVGVDGIPDEDTIEFTYTPIIVTVTEDKDTGNAIADLEYDEDNDDIETIIIRVYDDDGNLVSPLSPITVNPPNKTAVILFSEYDLPEGRYLIETTVYNGNGDELYKSYDIYYIYKPRTPEVKPDDEEAILVPDTADTGGLFGSLNISKIDYLITGMIIFGIAGIGGIFIILKDRKKAKRQR